MGVWGRLPRPEAQDALARVFGTVRGKYFTPADGPAGQGLTEDAAAEVIAPLRRSSVDSSTLDLVRIAVGQLGIDYASRPAPLVLGDATRWLTVRRAAAA